LLLPLFPGGGGLDEGGDVGGAVGGFDGGGDVGVAGGGEQILRGLFLRI
jgi:hypothetical protein